MEVGSSSDVGLIRARNEDDLLADRERALFAVADGLGGHAAGHVASRIAIRTIDRRLDGDAFGDGVDHADLLCETLREAHRAIVQDASRSPDRSGMGTTVVLAHLGGDGAEAWIAHVGDSRAYLSRGGELHQVTRDHRSAGLFGGGRITQALGSTDDVEPDVARLDLEPGDRLLLCTDGLTDMVGDARIAELAGSGETPQIVCDDLVEAAKLAGGADNITVILVDVGA